LVSGGEILAQRDTFLPVAPPVIRASEGIFLSELEHWAGFLPVFHAERKFLTVAQPLLNGGCDEMR
jgi:hypothetical protein